VLRSERRATTRGHWKLFWDLVFSLLRFIGRHAHGFYTTVGIFLLVGAMVAILGVALFANLAGSVREGGTQAFDDAVMHWVGEHPMRSTLEPLMVEITMLGTGSVVMAVVAVSGMFLWLTRHRYSAALLLVSTGVGIILNNLLKMGFDRERPQVFEWGTHAMTSSFPSGHAMSAATVYVTVAYLAARLQRRRRARWATVFAALVLVVLIALSRVYLGVHYPSDVAAGVVLGTAWAGFCMAMLEAIQLFARREATVAQQAQEERAPGGL
jgi:undecaprenyl-diphosphatase